MIYIPPINYIIPYFYLRDNTVETFIFYKKIGQAEACPYPVVAYATVLISPYPSSYPLLYLVTYLHDFLPPYL